MNDERITLTMKEQRINNILVKLISGEIKTSDAVRLTGLSKRQIYRKKKAYKENRIASIPHQSKNKSNNSPWRKGLPQMPSREASVYAYFHRC